MDLTQSIQPDSTQINAEDMLSGPMTVTIEKVTAGSSEQPVNVHLVELPGRPYRPSKSMRRVMVGAWGPEASNYTGRRMTLYRDPEVRFGGMAIGGIKISHLSHIDKPLRLALTVSRGKRAMHHIEPLAEAARPAEPTPEDVIAAGTEADLKELWKRTADGSPIRPLIRERVATLRAEQQPTTPPADPEHLSDEAFQAAAEGES